MAEIVDDVKIRLDMSETDKVIALAEDHATMCQALLQIHSALRVGTKPLILLDSFNDETLSNLVSLIADEIVKKGKNDDGEH